MRVSNRVVRKTNRRTNRRHVTPRPEDMDAVYNLQAQIGRAVGHPLRIHILDLLSSGEKTGTELRTTLDIGKVNLSQHVQILKQAGLVRSRQRGRESVYSIAVPEITQACQLMRNVLAARLRRESTLMRTLRASKFRFSGA